MVLEESHLTKIWGDSEEDKLDALMRQRQEFVNRKQQPNETVGAYQKILQDMDLVLVGMGQKATPDKEIAMMCINGLDTRKHQDLQLVIKNRTRARPTSLADACTKLWQLREFLLVVGAFLHRFRRWFSQTQYALRIPLLVPSHQVDQYLRQQLRQ